MNLSRYQRSIKHTAPCLIVLILFGVFGSLGAQDVPPTDTPVVTDAPTEVPPTVEPTTEAPTVEPTLVPTEETTTPPPTEVPTDLPTDVPTDAVTETPVETATLDVTASPTVVSAPPVFSLSGGTSYEATAGTPLLVDGTVSDDLGVVRIVASGSTGTASLTTVEPSETSAPYVTAFQISYAASPDFVGADTLTLTAVNASGVQATVTLTINVTLPLITVTPTIEPTPAVEPMKELLINYNPAAGEDTIQSMLKTLGAIEVDRLPQIGVMRVLVPESESQPAVAMSTLQSSGGLQLASVTNIEANVVYQLAFVPNDPKLPEQWGLSPNPNASSSNGIWATRAWDASTARGLGIKVAVVDSGVDLQHPDLAYQLVPGWDFYNDDNSPDDDFGHGTHVAGIIAARANNLVGAAGVAFNAKIMPVKVCDYTPDPVTNMPGGCPAYFVAEGIIYAVDMGAQIINLSLAGPTGSTTLQGAINYALSRNVTVVAAAGNTGDTTIEYPAAYPGVIGVGAHDIDGNIWSGSTHNANVDISAPGVDIKSLWPVELDPDPTPTSDYGYTSKTGTSMAAAYVSGTAALLMSAKVATTPATVMDALVCGAEDDAGLFTSGGVGRDDYYGYGHLKADYAMNWHLNAATCKVTLANDNFQNAKVISVLPFSDTQPINDRSVTEQSTDPTTICSVPREQTLWYSYKPAANGYYQFSTLGSTYDTVIEVYRGSQGALTSVGCTATGQTAVPLDAAQTYYLVVSTNGGFVDNQLLQVRVNYTMFTNNLDYQENATSIAYTGMWTRSAVLGSSGGYTQQTSDNGAIAAFSFRGDHFDYVRTIGPDRGKVKIYINDQLPISVSNQAAIQKGNQVYPVTVPSGSAGKWNMVYIVRDSAFPGVVDIDRIRTYDFDNSVLATAIVGKVDDAAVNLRYVSGTWTTPSVTGAYYGKVHETSTDGSKVMFRFTGNALTLFRMTGPSGFADMQVTIDNGAPITVKNTAPNTAPFTTPAIRPYTIDGLTTMTHVVEVSKVAGAGIIQLDAVQAATLINLAAGTKYDDRSLYLAYRGFWQDTGSVTGAYLGTTRTLSINSEVSFRFLGNDLCIGYRTPIGDLDVYIDGTKLKTPPTPTIPANPANGIVTSWCMEADTDAALNGVHLADTVHYARLVATAVEGFTLDYVQPLRYTMLTPARGMVQETDASFKYGIPAAWVTRTTTAISVGTFKPQGGSLKTTDTDGNTVSFYINGTGFILYTAVGIADAIPVMAGARGCWNLSVDGVAQPSIDMGPDNMGSNTRYRPLGYGVSGLPAGIHQVVLSADTDCGLPLSGPFPVDFDAVRVFP